MAMMLKLLADLPADELSAIRARAGEIMADPDRFNVPLTKFPGFRGAARHCLSGHHYGAWPFLYVFLNKY